MDIASIRAELKLTQEQFAQVLGVSRLYIGHLERGRRSPSLRLAAKIEAVSGRTGLVAQRIAEKMDAA